MTKVGGFEATHSVHRFRSYQLEKIAIAGKNYGLPSKYLSTSAFTTYE